MTRTEFLNLCKRGIVCLDGATGTELAKAGLPTGVSPEGWIRENPAAITRLQQSYAAAGSNIVYAPTFGGNRLKLKEYGLDDQLVELNTALVNISRKAVGDKILVFGDIAPTGQFVEPIGNLPFEEAVAIFREQATVLLEAGVDGFAVETMMDLQEARAALIAIREIAPDIPVMVTMTFDESGRTLAGNPPVAALIALQALGADAFGCNCSTGPEAMAEHLAALKPYAKIPLLAKPNAGLPQLRQGKTVFDMDAAAFAAAMPKLVAAGASIVGGCCGTTPDHIAAMAAVVKNLPPPVIAPEYRGVVSGPRCWRIIAPNQPFTLIGERLNPTGKKALQADLRAGNFERVEELAAEQCNAGATLLDVNVGMPGIDEVAVMGEIIRRLTVRAEVPLCIDTTNPEVAEIALRNYPGRALFNSISDEPERLEKVLPIAAKYGAMLIALPVTEAGIPKTPQERLEAVERIFAAAEKFGYTPDEFAVDGLVMTISADPQAANVTLQTIRKCAERGWNTVCGLSNVSFGMPRRDLVNRAFLGLAIGNGLNMAIANPCLTDIMDTVRSADALQGLDCHFDNYLSHYADSKAAPAAASSTSAAGAISPAEALYNGVLSGSDSAVVKLTEAVLASGMPAGEVVDKILIPAITEVGNRFERKEYFLPQLIRSADTMRAAMDFLQPTLMKNKADAAPAGKIIVATVKGDIHDIGKNIVVMMLKNYNFQVIDLGKDVPAEKILDTAVAENCRIIGLSALMTTTMGQMKVVIDMAKERGLTDLRFMVGGAVVDQEYAASIGAEYSGDALGAVHLAQRLAAEL